MKTPRVGALLLLILGSCAAVGGASPDQEAARPRQPSKPAVNLGAFSMSLNVKDLAASRAFYEQLGFVHAGGDPQQHWLILRNGDHVIGLFQGMIPKNTLTFNPGWDQQARPVDPFTDVRDLQALLQERGLSLMQRADPATSGPAYLMLLDPDGNPILIDQHRGRPQK
jgi:catechol 2,3-dioxygenase-like lactoylglutathione lyase family enzyme